MGKTSCCDKDGVKKGPWTAEEDQKLIDYIQKHGHGKWRTLPKNAGLKRCGKSCRLRWANYLRPDIKRGKFSVEEEEIIVQLHRVLGNKWSAIAARLPGRTDNEIKNYWNTHIKKKLLRMGIDPVTHSPRLDLLQLQSILSSSLFKSPSSKSNVPNDYLLGMMAGNSTLNPQLLTLAAALLSNLNKNVPQNNIIQENPFQILQPNQLQTLVDQANCGTTTSSDDQASFGQFSTSFTGLLNCHGSLENPPWQNIGEYSNRSAHMPNNLLYTYDHDPNQNFSDALVENPSIRLPHNDFDSLAGFSFASTPLNSSSTVHANGGSEDERDSYCSNMMMFDNNPSHGLNV